jgi:hypothetical protein
MGPGSGGLVAADLNLVTASGFPTGPVLNLVAGDTQTLVGSATTEDGEAIPDPELVWSSTNPGLATVDSAGTLIALASGTLTITARVDDVVRELPVNIVQPELESVVASAEGSEDPQVVAAPPDRVEAQPSPIRSEEVRGEQERIAQEQREQDPPPPDSTPTAAPETTPAVAEPPPPDGLFFLRLWPATARVEIDGDSHGDVRNLLLSLRPGPHTLHVEMPGYTPFDTVFHVISGDTIRLPKDFRRLR